jgi:hypothetical protein
MRVAALRSEPSELPPQAIRPGPYG